MFKSFILISMFTTGVALPPVTDIQPVKGASVNISQISLNWDDSGFNIKSSDQVDFSVTLNFTSDHAVSLKF